MEVQWHQCPSHTMLLTNNYGLGCEGGLITCNQNEQTQYTIARSVWCLHYIYVKVSPLMQGGKGALITCYQNEYTQLQEVFGVC